MRFSELRTWKRSGWSFPTFASAQERGVKGIFLQAAL
jgi:hypothetical protein